MYGDPQIAPLPSIERDIPLTCEPLHQLIQGAEQFRRTLSIVSGDLDLQLHHGDVVYALDFSEIYKYLWPDKAGQHPSQIVDALLHSEQMNFTLLPGTIVELVRHLKRVLDKSARARQRLDDYTNQPMVAAFLRHFSEENHGREIPSLANFLPAFDDTIQTLTEVAELESLYDRLDYIVTIQPFLRHETLRQCSS